MIATLSCKDGRGLLANVGVDILWEACILKENVGFGEVLAYGEEKQKSILHLRERVFRCVIGSACENDIRFRQHTARFASGAGCL